MGHVMNSSEIRQAFFDFFIAQGHQQVDSSSLVPSNDPTLLFTNAGMVQFKDTFLGLESRPYCRAVSAQRCVRAGGKHNDLENVGYTARHHTFFEMLGNFSFGDYFKREAIGYAWTFLTQVLQLPPEKLWITVYQDDDEAADIWLNEVGVSPTRFSRCGEKDNFWSMGDTGPCGPCTEIFYDHGDAIWGGPPGSADAEGDRYIEIWNLVFMQYNRDKEGHLHPLPRPSVDTGMGLERIAAVVQGVHNNYDIDSFRYLIEAILKWVPKANRQNPSLKVIADHIRACSFLIADGVLPGNEGRAYVLRRIIRRAVRHGHKVGLSSPFFCHLVQPLIDIMGQAYPLLVSHQEAIHRVLKQEEEQFAKTLEQGLRLLQEKIDGLKGREISGDIAFKLYDTYGFPLDLTEDIAREQQLTVDTDGFLQCMEQQRALSQSASQFGSDYSLSLQLNENSEFHGYEHDELSTRILAIVDEDGKKIPALVSGKKAGIILEKSPFYAESGGQVGDQGELRHDTAAFKVEDTQQVGKAIVHYGTLLKGELKVEQTIHALIHRERRNAIRLNHTATHLLHAALKIIVGPHVQQKGSLVEAEQARFDFSHHEALTQETCLAVERLVNDRIRENEIVKTEEMNLAAAKNSGAMALFSEKYSDDVRVLSIGTFSKELCGGTHAKRTGDIGLFKIINEYGIASGVRRIELKTGASALHWVNEQLISLDKLASQLKTTPPQTHEKLTQLLQEMKQQEKAFQRLQTKLASQSSQELLSKSERVGDIYFLMEEIETNDNNVLRTTLDEVKNRLDNAVIILYSIQGNKMNVVAGISKSLLGRVPPASLLVKHLCGKGGGRDDMAQGGGEMPANMSIKKDELRSMLLTKAV